MLCKTPTVFIKNRLRKNERGFNNDSKFDCNK